MRSLFSCVITQMLNNTKEKDKKPRLLKTTKTYKSPKTNKTYKSTTVKVNKPNNTTRIVSANRYPRNKVVVVKTKSSSYGKGITGWIHAGLLRQKKLLLSRWLLLSLPQRNIQNYCAAVRFSNRIFAGRISHGLH
jgi:hypothetical protein